MAAGYVLPEENVIVMALTTFPGLPGRFQPGVPLSLFHMEIEEEEADAIIAQLEIPVEKVSVGEAEAEEPIDRGDGHLPSGTEEAEFGAAVEAGSPEAEAAGDRPYSEWTVAELDEAFGSIEGYPMEANKADKVAFAEAQG